MPFQSNAYNHAPKSRNRFLPKLFKIFFTGQALCGQCRDETHRAKMFSKHDIIHMSMKTKENAKKVRI